MLTKIKRANGWEVGLFRIEQGPSGYLLVSLSGPNAAVDTILLPRNGMRERPTPSDGVILDFTADERDQAILVGVVTGVRPPSAARVGFPPEPEHETPSAETVVADLIEKRRNRQLSEDEEKWLDTMLQIRAHADWFAKDDID